MTATLFPGCGPQETHRAYLINGLLMLVAFFGCRNVLGPYMSYRFFIDSQRELDSPRPGGFPAFAIWVYRCVALPNDACCDANIYSHLTASDPGYSCRFNVLQATGSQAAASCIVVHLC